MTGYEEAYFTVYSWAGEALQDDAHSYHFSTGELAARIDRSERTTRRILAKLVSEGHVRKIRPGLYDALGMA